MTTVNESQSHKPGSGECHLCSRNISSLRYMKHHLESCMRTWTWQPRDNDQEANDTFTHVTFRAEPNVNYWMVAVIRKDVTLRQVDEFLRNVWLECCNHLSRFNFGGMTVGSDGFEKEMRHHFDHIDTSHIATFDSELMKIALPGTILEHEYDMGSTSITEITVNGLLEIPESRPITVVAQNNPPPTNQENSPRSGYNCFSGSNLTEPARAKQIA